jgi:hypothetical protein
MQTEQQAIQATKNRPLVKRRFFICFFVIDSQFARMEISDLCIEFKLTFIDFATALKSVTSIDLFLANSAGRTAILKI